LVFIAVTPSPLSGIGDFMGKLEIIEKSIEDLPDSELFALRKWFDELLEQRVDNWLEREVLAGRFDALALEAMEDIKAGRTRPL
jgi:hypothetical protein